MPPLTMRGRYLMREYWSDSELFTKLTVVEREVYVGLWMLSDDVGYLPRDLVAIAAALYRYDEPSPRVERVASAVTRLRKLNKVIQLPCRRCLRVPTVADYPRPGKRSSIHHDEHQIHLNRFKPIQTHSTLPVPTLPNPTVPIARAPASEGSDARETASDEWGEKVARTMARSRGDA